MKETVTMTSNIMGQFMWMKGVRPLIPFNDALERNEDLATMELAAA